MAQHVFAVLRRDFAPGDSEGRQHLIEIHTTRESAISGGKNHLVKESAKASDDSPDIKEGTSKDGMWGGQCQTGEESRDKFNVMITKMELMKGVKAVATSKPKAKNATKQEGGYLDNDDDEDDDAGDGEDDEDEEEEQPAAKPDKKTIPSGKANSLKYQKLIFTGTFRTMDRKTCEATAKKHGAKILGPTKLAETTLVVLGERPGKKKVDEIEELGLDTVSEAEFLEMIETGEAARDEEDDDMEEEEAPPPKKTAAKRAAPKKSGAKEPAAKKSKMVPEGVEGAWDGQSLLFTGALELDRETCEATAIKYGGSIAKKLDDADYIVLGTKPGPKKVKDIEAKNLTTITEAQFFDVVQGGELPEKRKRS